MAKVKILIEGYTNADSVDDSGEEKTCCTISLVRDGNLVIVVDPGVLSNQKVLVDALAKEGLAPEDVNMVFLTHSHIDHFRNTGMFPRAKVLEYYGLWENDKVDDWEEQFTENIRIIKTPGHTDTGLTMLVKTEQGAVAIVGDIFWKENFPEKDEYANDEGKLAESRKRVLELADFIVPGHGPMYKVKK